MNFFSRQAEEHVEHERMQRGAEGFEFGGRVVELSAFVCGGNDEDAHVAAGGFLDGRPVFLEDPVPVEVDVVESAVFFVADGVEDEGRGGVGGEADVAGEAALLDFSSGFEAGTPPAVFADGVFEGLGVVDSVEGEKVNVGKFEAGEGIFEIFGEGCGVLVGGDFGLDDEFFARQGGEDDAELAFGAAVAAGGFDVVDAKFEGAADGGFEVGLVVGRDFGEGGVLPLVLVAHAAAGEDGHLKIGAAEAAVEHGRS